jgi:hypothetical protein
VTTGLVQNWWRSLGEACSCLGRLLLLLLLVLLLVLLPLLEMVRVTGCCLAWLHTENMQRGGAL